MLTPMENLNVFLLFKFKWYFIAKWDSPLATSFSNFKIQDTQTDTYILTVSVKPRGYADVVFHLQGIGSELIHFCLQVPHLYAIGNTRAHIFLPPCSKRHLFKPDCTRISGLVLSLVQI